MMCVPEEGLWHVGHCKRDGPLFLQDLDQDTVLLHQSAQALHKPTGCQVPLQRGEGTRDTVNAVPLLFWKDHLVFLQGFCVMYQPTPL